MLPLSESCGWYGTWFILCRMLSTCQHAILGCPPSPHYCDPSAEVTQLITFPLPNSLPISSYHGPWKPSPGSEKKTVRRSTETTCRRTCHSNLQKHFVSILCAVDSKFFLSKWDRLLPQIIPTLNLLRSSRIYPFLFAHHPVPHFAPTAKSVGTFAAHLPLPWSLPLLFPRTDPPADRQLIDPPSSFGCLGFTKTFTDTAATTFMRHFLGVVLPVALVKSKMRSGSCTTMLMMKIHWSQC
jgi:hypothetical protein